MGTTKKPLVDKFAGAKVKLEKADLEFTIGEQIHPKLHQARYCLYKLYASQYVDDVVPPTSVPSILITASQDVMQVLVPELLRRLDFMVETGKILPTDEGWVLVVSYVLAWWYYDVFGGTMPIYVPLLEKKRQAYRRQIAPYKPEWMCVLCFKKWKPHPRYKSNGVIAKQYLTWLYQHMWEYHRFDQFQPKNDTRPTLSELAARFSGKRSEK